MRFYRGELHLGCSSMSGSYVAYLETGLFSLHARQRRRIADGGRENRIRDAHSLRQPLGTPETGTCAAYDDDLGAG